MGRGKSQHSRGKNPKREADRRMRVIREEGDRYSGRCLFPADGNGRLCREPPSRRKCHVIPRPSVLNKLKDEKSGMVLEFDWGVNQWRHLLLSSGPEHPINLEDPATFEPRPVGTHDACTGLFACQTHDAVFNPSLDTDNPDFGNSHVRLLAIGRAVLYAADLASKRKFIVDNKRIRGLLSNANKESRIRWLRERKPAYRTHQMAHSVAKRWRSTWRFIDREGELPEDLVDWSALTFRSTLTFAACVFYGRATAVMVLPGEGAYHSMTILCFSEDSATAEEHKERLVQRARNTEETNSYGVSMINELMSNGNGVVAASPASYEELRDEDKRAIQQIIMEKLRFWGDVTKP